MAKKPMVDPKARQRKMASAKMANSPAQKLDRALSSGLRVAKEGAKKVIADRKAAPKVAAKAARAGSMVAARAGAVGAAGAAGAVVGTALYKKFGTKLLDAIQPMSNSLTTPTRGASRSSAKPAMSDSAARSTAMKVGKAQTKGVPTRSAFGNAFASARKSGKSEFTFKGKKYNTKVK